MTQSFTLSQISAVITELRLLPESDADDFRALIVQLMMGGARFPGFWSGELKPAEPDIEPAWKIIQRFSTLAHGAEWRQSSAFEDLHKKLSACCAGVNVELVEDLNRDSGAGVTTAIVTDVRHGMEEQYFAWEAKIQLAQAKFAGYRGLYLQPPAPGRRPQWATMLRFDSPASLERWFNSAERHALLHEGEKFVKSKQIQSMSSAFPGWINTDQVTGEAPPSWKAALLVLLGLFPIVMLQVRYVSPLLISWPPIVGSFANMMGSVAATSFVTMPLSVKAFKWWLYPRPINRQSDWVGIAIIVTLYIGEILLFSVLPK